MKRIQDNIVRFIDGANDDIKSLPNITSSSTESQKRIEQLNTFVEDVMVKGVDYGLINGFSKPTLLKPGAEKLCDVFGFSKTAEVTNRLEDWDSELLSCEVKLCHLIIL
ncbi:hypothetical protein [Jeotgalibacillus salarius]|uniref:Uncharacterized protein n=1 Tax=Jeotgalibacillus salarius TaxID=546023 RepID=A0A4Y8LF68_9BACL|nr:hypothetical protein [Jeotgalibacillus salarius]TFE01478.1 hypothetical protein E2626_07845 [Jeotgalibacillus salarius]